jgi:hypothetical protein
MSSKILDSRPTAWQALPGAYACPRGDRAVMVRQRLSSNKTFPYLEDFNDA